MNEPETLPALYRMTAEIHERLAKGEKFMMQGKDRLKDFWHPVADPFSWVHLRERPREKTAEGLRIEANLRLKAEWLKEPFPLLYRFQIQGERWSDWVEDGAEHPAFDEPSFEFKRKPAPEYAPWSFEDQLCGNGTVIQMGLERGEITGQSKSKARINGVWWSYEMLLRDWLKLGGSPAGKVKG